MEDLEAVNCLSATPAFTSATKGCLGPVCRQSLGTVWESSAQTICTDFVCESGGPDTTRPEPDTLADRCIDNGYSESQDVIYPNRYDTGPMVFVPDPYVQIEGGQVQIPSTQMASQHKHLHVFRTATNIAVRLNSIEHNIIHH